METPEVIAPRWWSRRLPPWVDASVYGVFFSVGLTALLWLWLLPLMFSRHSPWIYAGGAVVACASLAAYVWFFTPIYPLLELELPLPRDGAAPAPLRLARDVASGSVLWWVLLASVYPSVFVGTAIGSTIAGDAQLAYWALTLFSFGIAAILGTRLLPAIRMARPLWAKRLGQVPDSGTAIASPSVLRDALLGVLLLSLLVAPASVNAAAGAMRYRAEWGAQQWLKAGEKATLATGATFTTPPNWSAHLQTGESFDTSIGITQSAYLSDDSSKGEGSIHISLLGDDVYPQMHDPARLAESAGERPDGEAFGPESVAYDGWRGFASATDDYLTLRMAGVNQYTVWIRLEDSAGSALFISTDTDVIGDDEVEHPAELARRLIDFIDLRPGQSP